MIIYLSGTDGARIATTCSDMKQKFSRDRDPQGMNLVELRVGDADDGAIIEQLHAAPFLAEKRMVVLKGLIADGSKELHALLLDHMVGQTLPSDIIVLAIDEGELKPRAKASKSLLEVLQSQQYSQRFDLPSGKALEHWVAKEVTARGGTIDTDAKRQLAAAGIDSWALSHAIDQLVAYTAGRKIGTADVAQFVSPAIDDNIFTLVDAAVAGNTSRALSLMRDQYRAGKDAHYVYAMLLRQYRIMLDIADVLERGGRPDAKAMELHPFVLKKTIPVVERVGFVAIKSSYLRLLAIDEQIKTGSGDPAVLMDVFVGSL